MNTIDLSKLLDYFEKLSKIMNEMFPEGVMTWKNVEDFNIDLEGLKHPDWVKAHFPIVLIYHKPKAGKLRKSKSISVMYQNNKNILTQLVWTADNFGQFYRKNKHKGFQDIVAGIQGDLEDLNMFHAEMQKPVKYMNFDDLALRYPDNIPFKAMCSVLAEHYPCDSTGQMKLL